MTTAIDSHRDVANLSSLGWLQERYGSRIATFDAHLVVRADIIAEFVTAEANVFNGFDEIWCFEAMPGEPRPDDLAITSDAPLEGERARRVAAWMEASGAGLGLGDGAGLNYATFDPRIADVLARWHADARD